MKQAGGIATTRQLLTVMTRQQLDVQVRNGNLIRVWYGVYTTEQPDLLGRLAALDVFMGKKAVCCMDTARRCMASISRTRLQSMFSIRVCA